MIANKEEVKGYPKIKPYQMLAGYSDAELAKELGIATNTFRKKRRGETDFTLQEAVKTAKVLQQDLKTIFLT